MREPDYTTKTDDQLMNLFLNRQVSPAMRAEINNREGLTARIKRMGLGHHLNDPAARQRAKQASGKS